MANHRPPDLIAQWSQHVRVVNSYGPTEATVAAVMSEPLKPGRRLTLGRPIDGVSVVVLDSRLQPSPIGSTGELYLMGAGLARGYVRRTALTAERFVAAPFAGPSNRMYRTGDLVRWTVDRQLEFVGRADHQVKIRGVRVELGEVEATLASVAGVASALAVVDEGNIAAYVVPSSGVAAEDLDTTLIMEHLTQVLTAAMLPTTLTVLSTWPVTAHGKIDRDSLPSPRPITPATRPSSFDHHEDLVATVMADVLGIPALTADTDFFAAGGNSLAAVYVANRLAAALNTRVGVRDVFDAPTPSRLSHRIRRSDDETARPEPVSVPAETAVQPSLAQQRLWLLSRIAPESSAYNIAFEVTFDGPLDATALAQAFGDVERRHPILRTTYPSGSSGAPVQSLQHGTTTLTPVPIEEYEGLAADAARRGFDVTSELPFRLVLTSFGDLEHRLTVVAHHIAVDGLSFATVVADLAEAYHARCRGTTPDWPTRQLDYRDFSLWQRGVLGDPSDAGSLAHEQLAFWDNVLHGLPAHLVLPTDGRRRPAVEPAAGSLRFEIPANIHTKLTTIARQQNATLFMALHAVLAVMLHKITGAEDFAIGTPTSGRTHPAFDSTVGMFVGTVALRTRTRPADTFVEFLEQVREVDLAAMSHADVPFDWVVDRVTPHRGHSRNPLFRVMLALDVVDPDIGASFGSLHATGVSIAPEHARFDIEMTVREDFLANGAPGGIEGSLRYASDLFGDETVSNWMERLLRVCEAVTTDPHITLRAVDVLSSEEHTENTENAHIEPVPLLSARTPIELFLTQAAAHRDAIAVGADGNHVTYGELEQRSAELAGALIERGVRVGDRVAIAVPRSAEFVLAVLAVVRVGGVYVPVDLAYPDARIEHLLSDAAPTHLLCTESAVSQLKRFGCDLVDVGAVGDPGIARRRRAMPGQDAYVIYTSGSTGAPKGVVVSHANIAALLASTNHIFDVGANDVWTMFHSGSFDFSVWEMWGALATGGRLVPVDPYVARSTAEFVELVVREGVTVLNQTPSAFYGLAAHTDTVDLPVRLLIFGGEPLDLHPVRRWLDHHRDTRAVNMFGITETTVHVTAYEICAGHQEEEVCPEANAESVIGSALPGLRTYALDASLRQVPEGSIGELYVAGHQVSSGYSGKPALTATRFVPEPGFAGSVMYRSGDLVRARGAVLTFIGRADSQIELRGYRIEPGEIESVLLRRPEVTQAAVVLRHLPTGPALVGYIAPDVELDVKAIAAALHDQLPAHLIPSLIVPLPTLPTTTHGKLDRDGLPDPTPHQPRTRLPRDPMEEAVAAVFSELLHLETVDVTRSFFDQGGNSLIATRLAVRLSEVFDIDIDVREVFEHPTASELSADIGARIGPSGTGSGRNRIPLAPAEHDAEPVLSPAQHRMWILNQFDTAAAGYNIPVLLRIEGDVNTAALREATEDVVRRHETLRTIYPIGTDGVRQLVLDSYLVAPTLLPVPTDADSVIDRIAELVGTGFDVTVHPPLRAELFHIDDRTHLLALIIHHIAADAWSMDVLIRDALTAYSTRAAGTAPTWTPLPIRYIDYSIWQRDSGVPDHVTEYWLRNLADLPEQVTLPLDHPRPLTASGRGRSHHVDIDDDLHTMIGALARNHRATTFMVMHAALAVLLSRYTGSSDVPIGTVSAGRSDPQLDDLVGMFAGTLVLRTAVDRTASFADFLSHVHQQDLAAYAHANMPFETLVELLNPTRSPSHHPLFQVALSFQAARPTTWELPGLTLAPMTAEFEHANFDLQLNITDTADGRPMRLEFAYNADLFDDATVCGFAERYVRVLEQVAKDPGALLGRIDLLDDAERSALLPARSTGSAAGTSLAAMLTRGVQIAPDALAVRGGGEELTYRDLDRRSDDVAADLRATGAGPERFIPWTADRTVDSIIRLWAITKTGAAPALVDPAHPPDRTADALSPAGAGASLPEDRIVEKARDASAAYVVFTSGTSGTPKAVVVTHAGLGALAADLATRYHAVPGSRVLHRGAPGFDMTLLEVLIAGSSGATLILASDVELAGRALTTLLEREHITHLCVTPTVMNTIGAPDLPHLEMVMFGGERLSAELIERWSPGRRVVNGYGPAEATMYTVATEPLIAAAQDVPIGYPIPGVDALVLDDYLEPVPPGVTGELYLVGAALARGYAEHPEWTAERFVAATGGTRMYRTGDLVRWKHTDIGPRLHYLGRNDAQLKINGVRVEPAEIESAIAAIVDIDFCATILQPNTAGTSILLTYVWSHRDTHLDGDNLRRKLADVLPAYMVPAAVVVLESAPPVVNGKLDARALPAPEKSVVSFEPPHTDIERTVAEAFAAVLGNHEIGRGTHFFDHGGNSLLATQVSSRLRTDLRRAISLKLFFAHPTVAELAAALEESPPEPDITTIAARTRPEDIPLSRQQHRMWVLNTLDTSSSAYNLPLAVDLRGRLDRAALEHAVNEVLGRHEILRTTYPQRPPVQRILPVPTLTLEPHPLADTALDSALHAFASHGFDVSTQLPIRVRLFMLSADHHVLAVNLHHIAADGGSLVPLVRDVLAAYAAYRDRTLPFWDPLPIQYADYALWDHESETALESVHHWQSALSEVTTVSPLIPDRRALGGPREAGRESFSLSAQTTEAVAKWASRAHATPFMIYHAVLSAVLYRLSGTPDIVIATAVDTRRSTALDGLIGMFVDTVPLRTHVHGNLTMEHLLDQVRDADLAAFEHSAVPVEVLSAILGGRAPQVALALQNFTVPHLDFPDLTVNVVEIDTGAAKFDMQISLTERMDGGADGLVIYSRESFEAATARSVADLFTDVMSHALADPSTTVADATTICAPAWASTPVDTSRTLAEILTATAARFPHNIAVSDGTRTLNYRELDDASNMVAQELVAVGAGPGAVLEINAVRSIEYIVQLWGITKTGAAFAPIAPDLPDVRRDQMRTVLQPLSPAPGRQIPEAIAYVIHTSGSTGTPKAVAVTHQGLGALTDVAVHRYGMHSDSIVLQGYNPSFDAALLEMMLAFGSGATLVIAPTDVYGGRELEKFVNENCVTHLLSTPAVLETLDPDNLPLLELIAVGGDVLSTRTAHNWSRRTRMLNAYGPTESSVVATLAEIDVRSETEIGIGAPILGTGAEVLDYGLRPIPFGGVGELYLNGPGLAMGYLGDPATTASAFVAAPEGARRYRTGDLVHRRSDGELGFLGRTDRQVKVRGVRIEPAEIEAVLRAQPDVKAARVILVDDVMTAFVVGSGPGYDENELKRELIVQLPRYLVPTRIITLAALPLTTNGKVDVDALRTYLGNRTAEIGPLTPTEELVTSVMSHHVPHIVGVNHDFFESGGDSLSATAVASRLSAAFGREVPVREVFENSTPRAMARWLDSADEVSARPPLVPRKSGDRVPLAPAQQRIWLTAQLHPDSSAYHLVFAVTLDEDLDLDSLAAAANDVLTRHRILRTVFPSDSAGPHQVVTDTKPVEFDPIIVDDLHQSAAIFASSPFRLERETPVRAQVMVGPTGTRALVLVVHHIALDGGSMDAVLSDLGTALSARVVGHQPMWDPLPLDYHDYSAWMSAVLGRPNDPTSLAHRQLDYWTTVLAGAEDALALPADRPRPAIASQQGALVHDTVDGDLYESLMLLARSRGVTVFMLMHSVLAVLLARESATDDVVVGTAVSLRNSPDLLGMVGMMVGTVALRTTIDQRMPFSELLDHVRDVDLGAMAHADVSFDDVVARIAPPRRTNEQPLFTVMLAYQRTNTLHDVPGITPLRQSETQAPGEERVAADYDLTWDITDLGDALRVRLLYATDLFECTTAELLTQRFARILTHIVAHPHTAVGDIDLLTAIERASLPHQGRHSVPPRSLADMFEHAATNAPESVALEVDGRHTTYRELFNQSTHCAQELVDRGIGPDDVVAIATGRGQPWLVALWAVARAGAAWVPLDLSQPRDRLEWIVTDSRATVGLSGDTANPDLPSQLGLDTRRSGRTNRHDADGCTNGEP